jgi:hypothetical protein
MISVTKLLGGSSYFGDRLRYHEHSAQQTNGARPGSGPVVVWNATNAFTAMRTRRKRSLQTS